MIRIFGDTQFVSARANTPNVAPSRTEIVEPRDWFGAKTTNSDPLLIVVVPVSLFAPQSNIGPTTLPFVETIRLPAPENVLVRSRKPEFNSRNVPA
jgi:hypothetical protein